MSRPTLQEDHRAALAAQVAQIQSDLFDYTGHVRRGMSRTEILDLVDELNRVRGELGWPEVDMTGRWRRVREGV